MDAAFMQFQRHGWDIHAVRIRHGVVQELVMDFLCSVRRSIAPASQATSSSDSMNAVSTSQPGRACVSPVTAD
jgi:hypothetical protein